MRASEPTLPDARGSSYSARSLTVAACAVKGVVVPVGARPTPAVIVATGKAVEVVTEVTKDKSLRCQRAARQLSERAGPNVSERRAGPENVSRGSRPSAAKGKATRSAGSPTIILRVP